MRKSEKPRSYSGIGTVVTMNIEAGITREAILRLTEKFKSVKRGELTTIRSFLLHPA